MTESEISQRGAEFGEVWEDIDTEMEDARPDSAIETPPAGDAGYTEHDTDDHDDYGYEYDGNHTNEEDTESEQPAQEADEEIDLARKMGRVTAMQCMMSRTMAICKYLKAGHTI